MMTRPTENTERNLAKFRGQDEGSMTILGLFFFIFMAILGAFAVDVMNIYAARTHLQTAADQAAHAALYNRYTFDGENEDAAKVKALEIVNATLPTGRYGQSLSVEDIEFGRLDEDTGAFIASPGSRDAVRVQTSFRKESDNALQSFLMQLAGVNQFDIVTESIFAAYFPPCLNEGFIAEGIVDIQSNNAFSEGFCIHSNTYVSLNNNNTFEPGTIVSMPDLDDLDLPNSGFTTNDGLGAALRAATMNIRILSRISPMIYKFENPTVDVEYYDGARIKADTPDLPDYITPDSSAFSSQHRTITTEEIYALDEGTGRGRVHLMRCQGPNGLTIDASGETLRDVIIISPCEIKFAAGSAIENAQVISKSTSPDSINAPAGLIIGRNDSCAVGGDAQLVTEGGISLASGVRIYGSQLLAKGDIVFTANGNGVEGASLIAGGVISGTSNMDMALCLTDPEDAGDNTNLAYFRLAG